MWTATPNQYLLTGALLLAVLITSGITARPLFANTDPSHGPTIGDDDRAWYARGHGLRILMEEMGGVQTLNVYGPGGRIIGQVGWRDGSDGQEVRHLLVDHLGSTRAALAGGDSVIARFEYAPHGETAASGVASAEVRYRYTGHPWGAPQGLYQAPARSYDASLGQFLSVDLERQGATPYAGGDPINFLDPSGDVIVPYFVKSGWERSTFGQSHDTALRSFAIAIGMYPRHQLRDATVPFGDPSQPGPMNWQKRHVVKLVEGDRRSPSYGDYFYNDRMFWIVDGTDGMDVPSLFAERMEFIHIYYPDFARKIVLVDVSKSGTSYLAIDRYLNERDIEHHVVRAELHTGGNVALGATIEGTTYHFNRPDDITAMQTRLNHIADSPVPPRGATPGPSQATTSVAGQKRTQSESTVEPAEPTPKRDPFPYTINPEYWEPTVDPDLPKWYDPVGYW